MKKSACSAVICQPSSCEQKHDNNFKHGEQNELQNNMTTMCICCDNIIKLQHNTLEFEQQKYKLK